MKHLIISVAILSFYSCNNQTDESTKSKTIESTHHEQLQEKYVSNDSDINKLRMRFEDVLLQFDSLTAYNEKLSEKYSDDVLKITKTKSEINRILLREKLTIEEKSRAERLINHMDSVLNYIKQ